MPAAQRVVWFGVSAEVAAVRDAVLEEAMVLGGHHWAGRYVLAGFPTGASLYLAPEAGFAWIEQTCFAPVGRVHGDVHVEDGALHLTNPALYPTLVPVRVGQGRFLILPGELPVLALMVQGLDESGWDDLRRRYLHHHEDRERPLGGAVVVPPAWRDRFTTLTPAGR